MRVGRKRWLLIVLAAFVLLTILASRDYVRGASLVVHAANLHGWAQRLTAWQLRPTTEDEATVDGRHGPLRVRVYRPHGAVRRTTVLTPGVHAAGYDEPRLVGLARDLASHGLAVVSPDLPDLRQYEVTPRTTDMIEDAARWAAARADLAPDGRVGLMGISFGGGLSVVAAGRPALRQRVAFALSFGGHSDFPRVLRYLCTGRLPDGSHFPPHDYGVVLITLGGAHRLVPPEQVDTLRRGILTFLNASHLDMVDKPRAKEEFQRARAMAGTMPEPAATLMRAVNDRDVETLGPRLLPLLGDLGGDPALSPERSPAPDAPVYLLHGADDNVIPAMESTLLARDLEGKTMVHHLISPLITHAEVDRQASARNVWALIVFWGNVVAE